MWGSGFLFIKLAVEGMSPPQYMFVRVLLASIVLGFIMVVGKRAWPQGLTAWLHMLFLGFFSIYLPSILWGYAGERIPSALSAIYNASIPVVTVLITIVFLRQEKVGLKKIIALIVGAIGMLIVFSPWNLGYGEFNLIGQLCALGAVLSIAMSFAYTRKFITPLRLDPVGVATGQVLIGMAVSIPPLFFTDASRIDLTTSVIVSVVILGVVGSGFSFVWNFQVIEQWGASSASMVTYLATITGVFAGVVFLRETLTAQHLIGAVLVLVAVAIGINTGRGPTREAVRGSA